MLSALKKSPALRLAQSALDTLLPPRCSGTGVIVDGPGMLSADFWQELAFIGNPHCDTCGLPFDFNAPDGTLCASCIDDPPKFDLARSAVTYNDASRKLILDFKYGDKLHIAQSFIPWMTRAGADLLDQTDIILPVPLHAKRLFQRRFNQSAAIASLLAEKSGKKYKPDVLVRDKYTIPQKGLSRKERNANVKNAFAVRNPLYVNTKNILLIDDVFTSGATLNECARILKKSGATNVHVLTVARVTKEEF